LPLFFPPYWVTLVTQMLIFGIMAMSLDILLGYTGLPSFGHAGFFGTSAYVVAVLSTRYGVGFWPSAMSGILLTAAVGATFGLLCSHLSALYYAIITLALGMCLWGLAFRWVSMTGGDNGISGIPRPDIGLPLDMTDPATFYYFTLVIFILALWGMYILIQSPFGQSLKGIRESESRMRVLGYNIWLHKYLSYVLSATFASISGILWAYYNAFVSPMDLDVMATFEAFFMVILGGPGTLIGSAVGAGVIIFLKNFISAYTQRWLIILGTIYIIIILYAPEGLVNLVINFLKAKHQERVANSLEGSKE
jgi:branched-chain amino acid transport system permease protein